MSFDTMKDAQISPLAKRLLRVDGVKSVMLGQEIITVTKTDDAAWPSLKPDIFATIMDFFSSGHAVLDASSSTGVQRSMRRLGWDSVRHLSFVLFIPRVSGNRHDYSS